MTLIPARKANLPKPYYRDEWVTIYHGDNRVIRPDFRFDLMLTDPPYGLNEAAGKNKSRSNIAKAKDYGSDNWDNETPTRMEIFQLIQSSEASIIFGGNYFELYPTPGWIVWDKENGANDFADCELAWTNLLGAVRKFKYRWNGMIQSDMKNKEFREHPTQKPVPVIQWCIQKAVEKLEKVETIFDPFAGSCTTARAAKNLKIKCVCIEREEKYCEVGARRMAQEVLL